MDQGMLSLKWENHKNTFVDVLSSIRQKESYCDATIACDNKFYNVHKLVLSTCSEYLRELFDNVKSFSSNNLYPVIVLQNVKFKYLEALLDYMYQGEVNVLQSDLPGLIKTAECLRIRGLAVPDDEPTKRVREIELDVDVKRQRREEKQPEEKNQPEYTKEKLQVKSIESYHENDTSKQETRKTKIAHRSLENLDDYSENHERSITTLSQNSNLNIDKSKQRNMTKNVAENFQSTTVNKTDVKQEFSNEFEADCYEVRDYIESGFEPTSSQGSIPHSENYLADQAFGISNQDPRGEPHSSQLLHDDQQSQNYMSGFMENLFMDGQQQLVIPKDINEVQPQTFSDGRFGFACPFCLKFYRHKHAFQYHYKTHTGEKPYGCPECPKRFIQRSDLNNHLKIHIGETPFACPQCPRRFIMKNALDKHFRTHAS
ncbi:unnamed protein product, partial [Meganyctiphanes norvegica]